MQNQDWISLVLPSLAILTIVWQGGRIEGQLRDLIEHVKKADLPNMDKRIAILEARFTNEAIIQESKRQRRESI